MRRKVVGEMSQKNYTLDILGVVRAWLLDRGIDRISYFCLYEPTTSTIGNHHYGVMLRYKLTGNEAVPYERRLKFTQSELEALSRKRTGGCVVKQTIRAFIRAKLEEALG
jgi:hypothetical protein